MSCVYIIFILLQVTTGSCQLCASPDSIHPKNVFYSTSDAQRLQFLIAFRYWLQNVRGNPRVHQRDEGRSPD